MVALILKLKQTSKNTTVQPNHSPSLFFTHVLPPSNCCLLFLCNQLWENKAINCTTDYTERHQSPSTKKPHRRKISASFQVRIFFFPREVKNGKEAACRTRRRVSLCRTASSCSAGRHLGPRRSRCRPRSRKVETGSETRQSPFAVSQEQG